jgi:hypothetical protein
MNNQDKAAWIRVGDAWEKQFEGSELGSGVAIYRNPAKDRDPYAYDFRLGMPCDLKTRRTRFYTADRYNINPYSAITINKNDIDRYREMWPHIVIIFDVRYPNEVDRRGIKYGKLETIRYSPLYYIIDKINRDLAKLHYYEQRVNDRSGNAKESYVLDCMWFNEFKRSVQ